MDSGVVVLFMNLILTIVIEHCVASLLNVKKVRDLLVLIGINLITNPLMSGFSFVLTYFGINGINYWLYILLGEVVVFFVETLLIFKTFETKINPFKLSAFINISSFGFGLIISWLLTMVNS